MKLGQRIASIRVQKGMTQVFVASKLGRTPQWLSNIEKGRRTIGAEELHKLAEVLGVEVGIFFAHVVNTPLTNVATGTNGK